MTICHSATVSTEKEVLLVNSTEMDENKDQKKESLVEIIEFGPLRIKGNFIIKDMKRGKEESPEEIFLCRCGRSSNKPYCDESHKR